MVLPSSTQGCIAAGVAVKGFSRCVMVISSWRFQGHDGWRLADVTASGILFTGR
jgi:hypothetical protein